MTQYEINLSTPVFIRTKRGRLTENGTLADYPGKPAPKSLDRIMRFDMLRRITTIHAAIQEISKLKFSKEQQRLFRVYCSEHYGLPVKGRRSLADQLISPLTSKHN